MTDIVERLRMVENIPDGGYTPIECGAEGVGPALQKLCGAAADEIERLRATIAQLRSFAGAVTLQGQNYAEIRKGLREGHLKDSDMVSQLSIEVDADLAKELK